MFQSILLQTPNFISLKAQTLSQKPVKLALWRSKWSCIPVAASVFSLICLFLIRGQLLYNVALIFAIHQHGRQILNQWNTSGVLWFFCFCFFQ